MPTIKLTQLAADRTNPPSTGNVTYWDSQLPGFGVRISSKGRRTWVAMYRVNGKAVMETLGTMAVIPKVDAARDLARASMVKARSGVHPVEQRREKVAAEKAKAEEQQKTFAWLIEHTEINKRGVTVTKGFIEQYAKLEQRPGSLYQTQRMLNRVMPYLGNKLVTDIKRGDITEVLDDIVSKRLRKRKDLKTGPASEARAIQSCLSTVFRWAVYEDLIPPEINPMLAIRHDRHGKPGVRDRVLSDDEIKAFWSACDEIGWPFGPIGKLLLLTGQRQGQVSGLREAELNLSERIWTLPSERTKNGDVHIVPLTDPVIELIEQLPHLDGDLIFSLNGKTIVTAFSYAKERLDASMTATLGTLKPWVWHDLRRTARTRMSKCGVRPHVAERVLGHALPGLERVYDHYEYLDEKRVALASLATMLERIIRPVANVVPLRA
jgi:integrase